MELDPRRIASAPAARVLLLDRDGLPVDPRLERGFREAGADVELLTTTDWVEFISPAGEKRSEPPVSIEATIAWLARSPPSGNGRASGGSRAAARDPGCHGTRVADQVLVAPGVRERILRLDGQLTGCFATATEPVDGVERVPVTALMLHAYHTGPGRMWVELARRWAARGVTVVRADLPGLHESPGRSPRQLRDRWLYRDEFIAHSMALVDALPRIGLSSRIMLGGFCAGAYWAMHAAIGDPRVTDLLLVNQFVVRWHDELVAERLAAASAGNLRRRAWRRLRTRELSVETLREGVGKVVHERRAVSRPAERAHSAELMRALAQLDDQRTETVMVFTEREPLLDQIRRAGVHKRLAELPHLTLEELPVIDHNLWAFTVQASVHEALDRALERALARIPGDAPPPSAAVESTI
jgi:hypothetical protein